MQQRKIRFDLLITIMIGMPILELQRANIIFGVVFVSGAYIYAGRYRGHDLTRRLVAVAVVGVLALGTGILLGLVREHALAGISRGGQTEGAQVLALIRGELSPVLVYSTIRSDTGRLFDFQAGKTIFPPLAFKLIPRSWNTAKPTNSAAFYATHYHPGEFAAGFVIAPTFWTALYLNFGYPGAIIGSFLLGMLTARIDRIFTRRRTQEVGWLLIFYWNYYLLLRQDVADTLAALLLTGAVYVVVRMIFRARLPVAGNSLAPSI